jgi:sec-independent protein translocase protein TatA
MVYSSANVMLAGMLGGWEIVLILAVVLILFGAKKLPELAKGLGSGIKEFKKATREVTDEISTAMDDNSPPARRIQNPPANTVQSTQVEATPGTPNSPGPKV